MPAELADAAAALERIWRAHVRPLVPDGGSSTCTRTWARTPPTARASISPGCSRPWTPAASPAPARSRSSLRPAAGYAAANAEVLAAAAASDGRVLAFCRSEPGERFLAELTAALDAGARGIKLHTSLPGFDFSHPAAGRRLRAGRRARRADAVPHGPRGAAARARPRAALLERNPGAQVVLAHCAIADLHARLRAAAPEHPLRHLALERPRRAHAARRGRARAGALRLRRAVLHADRHAGQALPPARAPWARARRSAATRRRAARSACWRGSRARSWASRSAPTLPLPSRRAPAGTRVPRDGGAARVAADARPHRPARARAPGARARPRTSAPRPRSS